MADPSSWGQSATEMQKLVQSRGANDLELVEKWTALQNAQNDWVDAWRAMADLVYRRTGEDVDLAQAWAKLLLGK